MVEGQALLAPGGYNSEPYRRGHVTVSEMLQGIYNPVWSTPSSSIRGSQGWRWRPIQQQVREVAPGAVRKLLAHRPFE